MKNKWGRYLIEIAIVTVIVGVLEIGWMRYGQTQGSAPASVLGAATSKETQMEITTEITRLEGLLNTYPTYPPLLLQLAKLNRMVGSNEQAEKYENELVRLGAKIQ